MKENILINSIKKNPKDNLSECLINYKKERLIQIADTHKIAINKSLKKAKIVEELENTILETFSKEVLFLYSYEIELINSIINNRIEQLENADYNKYSFLSKLGYLHIFEDKKVITPVIPNELKEIYLATNTEYLNKNIQHNEKFISHIKALLRLYGLFEIEQLVKVWNELNYDKLTIEETKEHINAISRRNEYFWVSNNLIVSEIIREDEMERLYNAVKDKPYYTPTKTEIKLYENNEIDKESIYYNKIKEYIKKNFNLSEYYYNEVMIWILVSCLGEKPPNNVFEILKSYGCLFKNLNEINKFMKLFTDLTNNTRKWILRGATPLQVSGKKMNTVSETFEKLRNNIKSVKAGRNSPCPCGSGKKFKFCCYY